MVAKGKIIGSSLITIGLGVVALSSQIASFLETKRIGSGEGGGGWWSAFVIESPALIEAKTRHLIEGGSIICACGILILILKRSPKSN
jgi:hypothetical protein